MQTFIVRTPAHAHATGLRGFGLFALFAVALCGVPPLAAMSYVQMRDADLLSGADGALMGTVLDAPTPVFDAEGVRVAARYRVVVGDDLGRVLPSEVMLEIPGWQGDEGAAWQIPGVVTLEKGQTALVVYERRADGVLRPLQINLGVFVQRDGPDGPYLDRALEDLVDAAPGRNAEFGLARDPARFKAYVRSVLSGAQPRVDYLEEQPLATRFTSLTGGGTPVRWFQFDQGTTINWRANSDGQTGMVQDEFALLQTALAAWTNDATSRVQLGYAGSIDPLASDPPSPSARVRWNDPSGEIAGSFNCATGGVLAIAGPSWFFQPTLYRGISYHPIQTGRLVTQDGAGCFFDGNNGANGALVFAHEVGHTLGFGHSCGDAASPLCSTSVVLNDALMRATAHNDGRGASLRADDIAAANQWYFASVALPTLIFSNGFE